MIAFASTTVSAMRPLCGLAKPLGRGVHRTLTKLRTSVADELPGLRAGKDCLGGAIRVGKCGHYFAATMGCGVFHECHASRFGLCYRLPNSRAVAPLDRLECLMAEMLKGNALRISESLAE